jgi:hypothetical protein
MGRAYTSIFFHLSFRLILLYPQCCYFDPILSSSTATSQYKITNLFNNARSHWKKNTGTDGKKYKNWWKKTTGTDEKEYRNWWKKNTGIDEKKLLEWMQKEIESIIDEKRIPELAKKDYRNQREKKGNRWKKTTRFDKKRILEPMEKDDWHRVRSILKYKPAEDHPCFVIYETWKNKNKHASKHSLSAS